jgi:hypothetical protein
MQTYTGNIAPNASRAQISYSSDYYVCFNTPGTSVFTIDSIAAANGSAGSTVVVQLDTSSGDIRETTIEVENDARMYYNVGLSINVPKDGWVHILLKQYGCSVYWEYVAAGFPFGNTGNGSSVSTIGAYDLTFTAEYNTIWTIDGQNDGYPYPTGTDPTEFTEFEKDADGYPLNWGVWKLDDQNEGYPWPTGYLPARVGGGIYVFGATDLLSAQLYVFGESGLLPAQIITMK